MSEETEVTDTESTLTTSDTDTPASTKPARKPRQTQSKRKDSGLVSVFNPNTLHFVQPSTGIRIGGKQTKDLKDDSWLKLQTQAGVLNKA